jgi:eukaryotic-like serine/threonine-protein kinase
MLGRQFAHYEVLDQAGAGGMGVVYRARDEKLQREVALKLPAAGNALPEEVRAKMLAEARAASALNHPNICTIYEVGDCEGQPYIAMEYLAGAPLNERIPPGGLPAETVLNYGAQIASALEHAHLHGVLHRDLKSANVRLNNSGQVKVLDFGLALSFKESELEGPTKTNLMDSGTVSGTLAYLPPEVLSGDNPDVRSDVWSLGVLLYEMSSGALPFRGRTGFELSSAILREAPRPLPTHVPPGVRAVILHCLAKEPDQRYQRASEVKAALDALHSNGGVVERFAGPAEQQATRTGGKVARLAAIAGVTAVMLAVLAYFAFWGRSKTAAPIAGGKLRLLVSSEKNVNGPALSPDGKMLAYVESGEKSDDLYVARVAGGQRVRLTTDLSRKGEPVFSPDGEKLAFTRKQLGDLAEEICTIATLGGDVVAVASPGSMPAWSPDGTRLAFVMRKPGQPETLEIGSLNGGEARTIFVSDAVYPFLGKPSWSPDGQTIALARSRGGSKRDIWLMPVNEGSATQFTQESGGSASDMPVFSADGSGMVFRSNRGGAWNLWYQELHGGTPRQLTTGPGPDLMPSLARNGSVAFLNSRGRFVLFLYDLQSAETKTVLTDSAVLWAPVFSPDGAEIAYSRGEPDGSWHLWTASTEGSAQRQITFGKIPEVYPHYTPGGSEILYHTWGAEPLSVEKVSHQGGPARPLVASGKESESYADASPDGKWIVFTRTENKEGFLYVRAADGTGEARRVAAKPAAVPRWSPDGKWIAFSPDRGFVGGIFVVHPDGSGLKRVSERGGWPVWWPGSDKIGMQVAGPDGNTEIDVVNLQSGEKKALPGLKFSGQNFPFDVSRDGKWLVTTNSEHISDEIWLLEAQK